MYAVLEQLYSLPAICEEGVDVWVAGMVDKRCYTIIRGVDAHWQAAPEATQEAIAGALGISGPTNFVTDAWLALPTALREQYAEIAKAVDELLA